jgi:hypothetical protein
MIEILVNDVTVDGMRRVKVVSDAEIDPTTLTPGPSPIGRGEGREWSDDVLGLHYLEATWPCREVVDIKCEGWPCARRMVLWKLLAGERVSGVLGEMLVVHHLELKCFPDYAFMRKLPGTIENGFEVDGVEFHQADWVPPGCIVVAVGG